ncbi:hypothetical protein O3G_MSEX012601 [Manduca sexta]|uniref:Uncharacterized protein n=1 Tax=Manduca sexta TaxID=7130 RepID=A0A921ZNR7_MANSE|nr:hypothetical protein O3G_MSEX012601 [Manduca sexta]
MKPVTAAILISLACMVQCGKDMYTSRYDSMNVDDVIGNHRLLHAYIKCMLDEGRCTAEGRELKKHITDALQTGCSRCTDAQKKAIRHVIKHLIEHEHDFWALLVEKYDPHRIYTTKYEAEMKRTMRSKEQMSESGAGHEKADMKMMEDGPGYKKADMKMMEGGSGHEKADMKMMEGGPGHEKADMKMMEEHITDALQTGCSRCTDAQKKAIRHVIKHLIEHEHDFWALLVEKYDPHRIYTTKYEADMKRTMRSKEQMSESGPGHEKADMKMMEGGPGHEKADMKMMEGGSGHEKADMKMMEGGPGHEKADMKMMEDGPGYKKADMKMMEGGSGQEKADMKMMDKMSSKTGMAEKKGA